MWRTAAGLVMLLVGSTAGGADPRQLIRLDRDFGLMAPYGDLHAYHLAVREALLGKSAHRSFEALVIASFQREWSVHLEPASSGVGQDVVCTIMQSQLHGEMEMAAERPNGSILPGDETAALGRIGRSTWRFAAPVSATTAAALERLSATMLARAVPLSPDPDALCIDGTSYYLFQWRADTGSSGGWARCSQGDTSMASVLRVLERLRELAGSSGIVLMRQDMAIAVEVTHLLRGLD